MLSVPLNAATEQPNTANVASRLLSPTSSQIVPSSPNNNNKLVRIEENTDTICPSTIKNPIHSPGPHHVSVADHNPTIVVLSSQDQ